MRKAFVCIGKKKVLKNSTSGNKNDEHGKTWLKKTFMIVETEGSSKPINKRKNDEPTKRFVRTLNWNAHRVFKHMITHNYLCFYSLLVGFVSGFNQQFISNNTQ